MATNYSDRDLSLVPNITFAFIDDYVKQISSASGSKHASKGMMYYDEGYVHNVKVAPRENGCHITAKCYRSMSKNEKPWDISIFLTGFEDSQVKEAKCSCPVGLGLICGHTCGVLFQIAAWKMKGTKAIPVDIAKTSLPQQFHIPRGRDIQSKKVEDITLVGSAQVKTLRAMPETELKALKSTLVDYSADNIQAVNWDKFRQDMEDAMPESLINCTLVNHASHQMIDTKFGKFPKGSLLASQQKLGEAYSLNVFDGLEFPKLPVENAMKDNFPITELPKEALLHLESIRLGLEDVRQIEENTMEQANSRLWYTVRSNRLTASNIHSVKTRTANFEKLVQTLKSTRKVVTQAMKVGLEREAVAADVYVQKHDHSVNLYPCGVVISPWAPWLAATPDRKVYNPKRVPRFGLLEIKCPTYASVDAIPYLTRNGAGELAGKLLLNRNHQYYSQMLMQLAVTGLSWCDFMIYIPDQDPHLETVMFDPVSWQKIKDKADTFYFTHFI